MSKRVSKNATFQNANEFAAKNSGTMLSPFTQASKTDKYKQLEFAHVRSLTDWSTTRFRWHGMPDTIDTRFLEVMMFYQGFAVFYYDTRLSRYLVARATIMGQPNVYGNPTMFRTMDMPGYRGIVLKPSQCVPIWSSYSRLVERDLVMLYAARLAEVDVSLRTVARAMRINTIVSAKRSQHLSFVNMFKQLDEGIDVLYTDENFDLTDVSSLDLGINPSILASLRDEKNQLWNEAMTQLGIGNSNQDKKERLVAAEVGANDDQIIIARNAAMKPRREAAEQINRMFDLSVSVEWDDMQNEMMIAKEGNNGDVHDGTSGTDSDEG